MNRFLEQFATAENLWRSHKVVVAGKILSLDEKTGRLTIDNNQEVDVGVEYFKKHNPKASGYWVMYENGYMSWSPADVFEGGYKRIINPNPFKAGEVVVLKSALGKQGATKFTVVKDDGYEMVTVCRDDLRGGIHDYHFPHDAIAIIEPEKRPVDCDCRNEQATTPMTMNGVDCLAENIRDDLYDDWEDSLAIRHRRH